MVHHADTYMGVVKVSLYSDNVNVFGCGTSWGDLDIVVWPSAKQDIPKPTAMPTKVFAGNCKAPPSVVKDCGKYTGTKECTGKGAGCRGEGWFSKDNTSNPYQRVNADQVCKDAGFDGADTTMYG